MTDPLTLGWLREHAETGGRHFGLFGPDSSAAAHCPRCGGGREERCTGRVGDGERCGDPAVVVSLDGEAALCGPCLDYRANAGRPYAPLHMQTGVLA